MDKFRNLKIKIFADGANKQDMLKMNSEPFIKGLTTNPTLMKKEGITDYKSFCKDILKFIKEKPISFEVFSDDFKEMERQAKEITSWGDNVYVKIPITNTKGDTGYETVKKLSKQKVKLNITAIMTLDQVKEVVSVLEPNIPNYISIFAGRAGDTGKDPIPEFKRSIQLAKKFKNVEILWASVREPYNYTQARLLGCHIITIPPSIIEKIENFGKTFNQLTTETVKAFLKDSIKSNFKI